MTVVLLVLIALAVVLYEADIHKKNKAFSAQAVHLVTPPGKRWWQRWIDNLLGLLVAALVLAAALRFMPRGGSDPTSPAGPAPSGSTPPASSGHPASPTSHSSTPTKEHTT